MPIPASLLIAVAALCACAASAGGPREFELEVLGTTSMAALDSLPEPVVEVREGRVIIEAHFGLGATGYTLVPRGTIADGVIDLLVVAGMPADLMGAQVLTAYHYRLSTPRMAPGSWTLRLHQVVDGEGDPESVLEQRVVVPR